MLGRVVWLIYVLSLIATAINAYQSEPQWPIGLLGRSTDAGDWKAFESHENANLEENRVFSIKDILKLGILYKYLKQEEIGYDDLVLLETALSRTAMGPPTPPKPTKKPPTPASKIPNKVIATLVGNG